MNNFTVFQKTRLPGVSANASLWMVIPGLDAASNRADRLKRRVRTYCKAVYQQNLRQWQFVARPWAAVRAGRWPSRASSGLLGLRLPHARNLGARQSGSRQSSTFSTEHDRSH
jgi:hypothetical protein